MAKGNRHRTNANSDGNRVELSNSVKSRAVDLHKKGKRSFGNNKFDSSVRPVQQADDGDNTGDSDSRLEGKARNFHPGRSRKQNQHATNTTAALEQGLHYEDGNRGRNRKQSDNRKRCNGQPENQTKQAAGNGRPPQQQPKTKPRNQILAKLQKNRDNVLYSNDGRCRVYGISGLPSITGPRQRTTSTCKYETEWFENRSKSKSEGDECDSDAECYDCVGLVSASPGSWLYWAETVEKLISTQPAPWKRTTNATSWDIDSRNPNCLLDVRADVASKDSARTEIVSKDADSLPSSGDEDSYSDASKTLTVSSSGDDTDCAEAAEEIKRHVYTSLDNMVFADQLLDRVLNEMEDSDSNVDLSD